MNNKLLERWAPWVLLLAVVIVWQVVCSAFQVSEFIFPSPLRIWEQLIEFRGEILKHSWRTFWVTMVGFGLAIVVGVLLSTAWLLARASGDWTRDGRLWLLTAVVTLVVWRTRMHLLWLLAGGAVLGGLGWV